MGRIGCALTLGNVAWAGHLVVSYYLAWTSCLFDDPRLLILRHLVTALALGVAILAWWLARRAVPDSAGAGNTGGGQAQTLAHERGELGFLGRVTALLSVVFVLAIMLTGAANFFLFPCV